MKKFEHAPGYVPNPDYTQEDWNEVCDNPELTEAEIAVLRPAEEVLPPALLEALRARRVRGPQKGPTKALVSMRLDRDVLEHFRATGPGWQARVNATLRAAMETLPEETSGTT